MDPRLGRSAFINFSNPNAYVGKFPVISTVSHPTASSQIDVLAHCSSYNLPRGTKRKFDGLSLGLGNSSSSESSKQSMGTGCTISSAKGSDDGSSIDLDLNHFTLGNEGTSRLDKRACDSRRALDKPELNLELSLSSQSAITGADFTAATEYNSPSLQPYYMDLVPTVDEGSTSARRPSGCQVLSFLNKTAKMSEFSPREVFPGSSNQSQGPAPMSTLLQLPKSPVACTSGLSRPQQRSSSTKNCTYPGCMKGARGSSDRKSVV